MTIEYKSNKPTTEFYVQAFKMGEEFDAPEGYAAWLTSVHRVGETGLCLVVVWRRKPVDMDYSQVERSIMAYLASSRKEAHKEDTHTKLAAKIFNVAEAEVTSEQRRQAKIIELGVTYGMGEVALSRHLGITYAQARQLIDAYVYGQEA